MAAPEPRAHHEQGKEKALGGGVPADAVVVADIAKGQTPELDAAMQGAQALIIASSAVPQVSFTYHQHERWIFRA